MDCSRAALTLIALLAVLTACSRGSSPTSSRQPSETTGGSDDTTAPLKAGPRVDARSAEATDAGPSTGLIGVVKVLEGEPGGQALLTLPGTTEPIKSAEVGSDGLFTIPDLEPNTYRLILPADGIHSTAEMYVTVAGDAGLTEVEVPRSRGCPVRIVVRDHASATVAGATLDLALSDLEQVPEPSHVKQTSNANGEITIVGSCVRGYLKGALTVSGKGDFEINHGYVGTGRDTFDIVLPEKAGEEVTYANDD